MPAPTLKQLRDEYRTLFSACEIAPQKRSAVDRIVATVVQNQSRYEAAGDELAIPWYFIGAVHNMESSLRFNRHLHNGDSLAARTVQVPAGRPPEGTPPFTWEASAADALQLKKLDKVSDWTIAGVLYQLERFNGFGYRMSHAEVLSPYLWSFSNHYVMGKYVEDGRFDRNAVSNQCGAAVIMRRLAEQNVIHFDAAGEMVEEETAPALATAEPLVTFSNTEKSSEAEALQRALNNFPGIHLRVDGVPGEKTSDALRKVTGNFLKGDPRAQPLVKAARP